MKAAAAIDPAVRDPPCSAAKDPFCDCRSFIFVFGFIVMGPLLLSQYVC